MKLECFSSSKQKTSSRQKKPRSPNSKAKSKRRSCNLCLKSGIGASPDPEDEESQELFDGGESADKGVISISNNNNNNSSSNKKQEWLLDNLNLSKLRSGHWTLDKTAMMFCSTSVVTTCNNNNNNNNYVNSNYNNYDEVRLLRNNYYNNHGIYSNVEGYEGRKYDILHGKW